MDFLVSDSGPSGSLGRPHEHVHLLQLVLRGHRPRPRKHECRLGRKLFILISSADETLHQNGGKTF